MRITTSLAIALLAGGVAAAPALAQGDRGDTRGDEGAQPQRQQQPQAGTGRGAGPQTAKPLTMQGVIDRVANAGYRDVREVEREDGRWEVYATDRQGRRVELYVDGQSGQIRRDD